MNTSVAAGSVIVNCPRDVIYTFILNYNFGIFFYSKLQLMFMYVKVMENKVGYTALILISYIIALS